jgi:hypothetical protein
MDEHACAHMVSGSVTGMVDVGLCQHSGVTPRMESDPISCTIRNLGPVIEYQPTSLFLLCFLSVSLTLSRRHSCHLVTCEIGVRTESFINLLIHHRIDPGSCDNGPSPKPESQFRTYQVIMTLPLTLQYLTLRHLERPIVAHGIAGTCLDVARGRVPDTELRQANRPLRAELAANTVRLDDALRALPGNLTLLRHLATLHEYFLGVGRETPVARHIHKLATRELGLGLLEQHTFSVYERAERESRGVTRTPCSAQQTGG